MIRSKFPLMIVAFWLVLMKTAFADIVFADVEFDFAFPSDVRKQFTFCDETTKLSKVFNSSNVYFKGGYILHGSDVGVYQVILEDKNGKEVGPLYSSSGDPAFISQSGSGGLFNVNGFTFRIPIKDLCKFYGNKPFASEEFEKLLPSLKLSAKLMSQ